ncbi:hypothetical protein F2Q69_00056958 [Brassica cretica]|uniref:Uncharacterized protein n=1 Tax=Brassica cretica TaxID=69181 RepID=A0A8S9N5L8_BRACR|nr:hypothetical protein F2Q69_00056958 [Brassica cretica]
MRWDLYRWVGAHTDSNIRIRFDLSNRCLSSPSLVFASSNLDLPLPSSSDSMQFNVARQGCSSIMGHNSSFSVKAFDDDSFDYDSGDIFAAAYSISSSEGEESDGEYGLNVVTETTAQRLGKFPRGRKKHRHVYLLPFTY